MKKIRKYLLLLLILLSVAFLNGCFNFREIVNKRISTQIDNKPLTREQLNEDLNILLTNLRDIILHLAGTRGRQYLQNNLKKYNDIQVGVSF
jgi:hypothetical protein